MSLDARRGMRGVGGIVTGGAAPRSVDIPPPLIFRHARQLASSCARARVRRASRDCNIIPGRPDEQPERQTLKEGKRSIVQAEPWARGNWAARRATIAHQPDPASLSANVAGVPSRAKCKHAKSLPAGRERHSTLPARWKFLPGWREKRSHFPHVRVRIANYRIFSGGAGDGQAEESCHNVPRCPYQASR